MARFLAEEDTVKVRMYRIGHGDCFLLALYDNTKESNTAYVLIDCGLKPGSQKYLPFLPPLADGGNDDAGARKHMERVIAHMREATAGTDTPNGRLDLVMMTHEHQDHVNGFGDNNEFYFQDFQIDKVWLAWTEDPGDPQANALRKANGDMLLRVVAARNALALAAAPNDELLKAVDTLLTLTLGVDGPAVGAGATFSISNHALALKAAMRHVKTAVGDPNVEFPEPGEIWPVVSKETRVRAFVLGPPRDEELLLSEDPKKDEAFPTHQHLTFDAATEAGEKDSIQLSPFAVTYHIPAARAATYQTPTEQAFFRELYGTVIPAEDKPMETALLVPTNAQIQPQVQTEYTSVAENIAGAVDVAGDDPVPPEEAVSDVEEEPNNTEAIHKRAQKTKRSERVAGDASWRRIDQDWLATAETLALRLTDAINNTSLALAFVLPKSGKVLLFPGDAQRGNWFSWKDVSFKDGDQTVTTRDLLGRTVLYKVGHHGSHNATLSGKLESPHPNLSWMATGRYAREFTAMIPAVTAWALTQRPQWRHPLPSIKTALLEKTRGRLFQTDTLEPETDSNDAAWAEFKKRTDCQPLYIDYIIKDE